MPFQLLGQVGDGAHIGGDLLARRAVAAGGALDQLAALVAERAGEAVDLRLGHHFQRLVAAETQEAGDARQEFGHVRLGEGVAEGEHGHPVLHLAEAGGGRGAHAKGGAVGALQLGKARLDALVAPPQRIVVGIADHRRVLLVIELVVLRDQGGEAGQLHLGLGGAQFFDVLLRDGGLAH